MNDGDAVLEVDAVMLEEKMRGTQEDLPVLLLLSLEFGQILMMDFCLFLYSDIQFFLPPLRSVACTGVHEDN